jgi:hypothetical protein
MKKDKKPVVVKPETTTIVKMDFELVEDVFFTIHHAFHPNGFDNGEEVDDRFVALWHLFLFTTGWTEDEFWATSKEHEHTCPDCGAPIDDDDEDDLELPEVSEAKSKPEDKPN